MIRVLVSACLIGEKVRFDGGDCRQSGVLTKWMEEGRVIPFCPEVAGGLPVPRRPAEIQADGQVVDIDGRDVTGVFEAGADAALALCHEHGIRYAVLKEGSPSCGSSEIHDGTFSGIRIRGEGATTSLLRRNGIEVFSERDIGQLERIVQSE